MRLLVTCRINLSMWVNSLRDNQLRVFYFSFLYFYDVLILFTSDIFIVVSSLEEVGPWKIGIFFFWMTFVLPAGFGSDMSFYVILTCQRNIVNSYIVSISSQRKMYEHFCLLPFLIKHFKFQVCSFVEITREGVYTILWLLRDFKCSKLFLLSGYWELASHSHSTQHHFALWSFFLEELL